jgi:glycosyltransferase involved in cell wall biosynthesis
LLRCCIVRVLVFGTFDVHSRPRIGILSDGFQRHGFDLSECHEPLGVDEAGRVEILQRPWMASFLLGRAATRARALTRAARAMPRPDAVLVGHPGYLDVLLARKLFKGVPIVLDHLVSASDAARGHGLRGGAGLALLGAVDRAALRRADVIVVDSDTRRDTLPVAERDRTAVSVVGAADEWLQAARPAAEVASDSLKVVFVGAFTPGEGTDVIGRALAELAGEPIDVTMIGNGPEHVEARVSARVNDRVTWVDRFEPADLPKLVADHDVCLGEFGPLQLGSGRFTSGRLGAGSSGSVAADDGWPDALPAKVLHAAAAGCAVVTAAPVARPVFGTAVAQVPPCDSAALASVLRRIALDTRVLVRMRESAGTLARERFAPDHIVRPIVDQLLPLMRQRGTP